MAPDKNKNCRKLKKRPFRIFKKDAAFTLIELLVVISIISLMAALAAISVNQARASARTARRRDDSTAIRTALQWYYHENGVYPSRGALGSPNEETDIQGLAGYLVPNYINQIPNDPLQNISNYQYVWKNNGQDYGLYIPYSNDGDPSCMFMTPNGSKNWFGKTPLCQY